MYRLFVALDLPEVVKTELSFMSFGMRGARWMDDDQLHLTLRFIGEVDGLQFREISEALAEVQPDPFFYRLSGVGHFPPRGVPKILWIGVEAEDGLVQLRLRVDAVLRRLGLVLERRKFSPHITLARLKNTPRNRVANFIAANNLYKSRDIRVEEFTLYSSVLTTRGAIHTKEYSYVL